MFAIVATVVDAAAAALRKLGCAVLRPGFHQSACGGMLPRNSPAGFGWDGQVGDALCPRPGQVDKAPMSRTHGLRCHETRLGRPPAIVVAARISRMAHIRPPIPIADRPFRRRCTPYRPAQKPASRVGHGHEFMGLAACMCGSEAHVSCHRYAGGVGPVCSRLLVRWKRDRRLYFVAPRAGLLCPT